MTRNYEICFMGCYVGALVTNLFSRVPWTLHEHCRRDQQSPLDGVVANLKVLWTRIGDWGARRNLMLDKGD